MKFHPVSGLLLQFSLCLLPVCQVPICQLLVGQELPPTFPELYNSETTDEVLLSPQAALDSLRLPDGFSAKLFSSEPDVQNPIAATIDALGRVWVAENYT